MTPQEVAELVTAIVQPLNTTHSALLEAQLMTVRALERIATVLEQVAVDEPVAVPVSTECLHPTEQRTDFGTTDGIDDWQCNVCGYRTVTP